MSNPIRYAIAAAAVLVVALVGFQFLPSNVAGPGGPPTATLGASPAASPTPVPRIGAGELAPGRYAFVPTPAGRLTFQLPAGWSGSMDGASIFKNEDQPGGIGFGVWAFDAFVVTHVYVDACLPPDKLDPIGPAVEDLVTAVSKQGSIDAEVTDISLAGRPAKRVVLTEPEGLDRTTCRYGADGPLQIWADSAVDNFFALAPGQTGVVYAVDAGGRPLVLFASYDEASTPGDIAELDAIVASMRME